jgi:MoxR-like ATPase
MKYGQKGAVNTFKYYGKPVKVRISDGGRKLEILDAPQALVPKLKQAEEVMPYKGRLHVRFPKKQKQPKQPKPKPKPAAPKQEPQPEPQPQPKPEKDEDVIVLKPTESVEDWLSRYRADVEDSLTEEERKAAEEVPVPDKGLIPAPFIDKSKIPAKNWVRPGSIWYYDHPAPGAPQGLLKALRDCFSANRKYQDVKPTNALIVGPPGTGKTRLIKKFADDTGLPYWHVIGRQGITAEELLGHKELRKTPGGGTESVWVEGIIPKAVRAGGILHIDEPNVIEGSVLTRLDELLDDKRWLTMEMEDETETIKAHPDLFVVFTMNPPRYKGVNELPEMVLNRMTVFELDFPPEAVEYEIVENNLQQMGFGRQEFNFQNGRITGKYGGEIEDFVKMVRNLRQDTELTYHPSIRNTIDFVIALKQGNSFQDAFRRAVGNSFTGYQTDRELYEDAMKNALKAVDRL